MNANKIQIKLGWIIGLDILALIALAVTLKIEGYY